MKELIENNIQVRYLGEVERFPADTQNVILSAVEKTKHNTGLKLCLAINYGSRREILLGVKQYAKEVLEAKTMLPLEESDFARYLMTNDLPELDLLIRTSGEYRISNFLLWQLAYAELIFTPVSWPQFDEACLDEALAEFGKRNRRFGGLQDE